MVQLVRSWAENTLLEVKASAVIGFCLNRGGDTWIYRGGIYREVGSGWGEVRAGREEAVPCASTKLHRKRVYNGSLFREWPLLAWTIQDQVTGQPAFGVGAGRETGNVGRAGRGGLRHGLGLRFGRRHLGLALHLVHQLHHRLFEFVNFGAVQVTVASVTSNSLTAVEFAGHVTNVHMPLVGRSLPGSARPSGPHGPGLCGWHHHRQD